MSAKCQKRTSGHSFNHLVGASNQRLRDLDAERVGSLEIYDQLDFSGLLDRQITGLFAVENVPGIDADVTMRVRKAVSIADQAAGQGVLAKWVHRGDRVAQGQCGELLAPAIKKWITADHERAGSQSGQGCEDRIEFALGARMQDMELQPEGASRRLQLSR